MTHVVKNVNGQTHPFDASRLYRSIFNAGLSAQQAPNQAELTAQQVVSDTEMWLQGKPQIFENDLQQHVSKQLKAYHPKTAYHYTQRAITSHQSQQFGQSPSSAGPNNYIKPSWLNLGKGGDWDQK